MDHYLQLNGLTKTYGDFTALKEVDLAIGKGEFITFLGPSGSGKTTTLMIIAGFEKATAGDVLVEGKSLSGLAPHERNIGIVFQNYALFPHKTAVENVYFPLQMRGVRRGEGLKKADEMLALVGLGGLGKRYPKELSGGQQQRVALARALVFEPSLLLLDEPVAGMNREERAEVRDVLCTLRGEGLTQLLVEHDVQMITDTCDAVAAMNSALDLEMAAAGNAEVVRHEMRMMATLGMDDSIEDILITLQRQYHLIRVLTRDNTYLFLYLALDRERANLALARHNLRRIEHELSI